MKNSYSRLRVGRKASWIAVIPWAFKCMDFNLVSGSQEWSHMVDISCQPSNKVCWICVALFMNRATRQPLILIVRAEVLLGDHLSETLDLGEYLRLVVKWLAWETQKVLLHSSVTSTRWPSMIATSIRSSFSGRSHPSPNLIWGHLQGTRVHAWSQSRIRLLCHTNAQLHLKWSGCVCGSLLSRHVLCIKIWRHPKVQF